MTEWAVDRFSCRVLFAYSPEVRNPTWRCNIFLPRGYSLEHFRQTADIDAGHNVHTLEKN